MDNQSKLEQLSEMNGFEDTLDFLQDQMSDDVCEGICVNDGCDYTCKVEPDSNKGYCEVCGTNTVYSSLVLGELI